ncbi:hypothetical protein DV515_00015099, partial [Chloebia gouldiae]
MDPAASPACSRGWHCPAECACCRPLCLSSAATQGTRSPSQLPLLSVTLSASLDFPPSAFISFPFPLLPVFPVFLPSTPVPSHAQLSWFTACASSPSARLFAALSLPPAYSTSDIMGLFFFFPLSCSFWLPRPLISFGVWEERRGEEGGVERLPLLGPSSEPSGQEEPQLFHSGEQRGPRQEPRDHTPPGQDEAALPPLPPRALHQVLADRRQQDPWAVLRAARHPGHPGPARGPGFARQRWTRRPGRSHGDARGEGRDGSPWSARSPRRGGQPRRGRAARREGGSGRVRRGSSLRLQRQALRVPQPSPGRPAHPLRRGAHQRAGPLRPGHGQVHLRGARPVLLRRARHRVPHQPAVRHHEERPLHRLLLPVLRQLAQAHLALGGHPGPPGARGRGVGAGGRGGLHRLLRQRQDGQHLHRLPRLLLLAKLRRVRLRSPSPADSVPLASAQRGGSRGSGTPAPLGAQKPPLRTGSSAGSQLAAVSGTPRAGQAGLSGREPVPRVLPSLPSIKGC